MSQLSPQDEEHNLLVGEIVDGLTAAAATLEVTAQKADALSQRGYLAAHGTREWATDKAIEIRSEAERVKLLLKMIG